MKPWAGIVLHASGALAASTPAKFSLSDLSWTLRNANGSIVIPGSVPSQAHLDLARAGVITEPLLEINDFTQRWIFADNWTYTADLSPYKQNLANDSFQRTLLVLHGIDTIANITLGDSPVAWVNNQFVQHTFDITDALSANGTNSNLTVVFESPVTYGQNVSSRPDVEFFPVAVQGNFEVPYVRQWQRKIQSDFGWDWGPAFVPVGIFKPAYLITLSASKSSTSGNSSDTPTSVFVEDESIEIYKVGQKPSLPPNQDADWIVNVSLSLRSSQAWKKPTMTISFPELNVTSQSLSLPDIGANTTMPASASGNFTVPNNTPELWYPHNIGTPKLYNVTITLSSANSTITSFTKRIGFRTIVLIQEPYPQSDVEGRGITPGDQYHFEINGKAFYSLGTNIIPFDPFYARVTTDQVRWILESAVKSGQNMLRVWGGGIYQPSDEETGGYSFYDLCDELGILAWSELIFSDTLYPINDFLLADIAPEVTQNVRRVNRHPSNCQWAGGNEIEGIVEQVNTSTVLSNGTHYLDEFVTLFQDYLHDLVLSETHSIAYSDCSTTSGYLSLDPYVLRFNNKTAGSIYGNSERYNYDASQAFNYSTYPTSRFVNEFGFHSMPSFFTWEEVLTSLDDFSFNSTVVASRDHHNPAGNLSFPNPNAVAGQAQMTQAVELWLPRPGTNDSNQTFAQWCYSTQVFQSMNMVAECAWYRRGAGLGENNLGALVWQLNDIWQGISWSSVEYSGRWKVLNYGLANVFNPVTIYPFWTPTNETLEIMVISDRWDPVDGVAQLTWYTWAGKTLNTTSHNFTVPSLNNSVIYSATGLSSILPNGTAATDAFMHLNVSANVDNKTVTSEQYFVPVSLANATLQDPQLATSQSDNLTFTLTAKGGVAPWTWLEHPAGSVGIFVNPATQEPSNGFYVIPGQSRTIQFLPNLALSNGSQPDTSAFIVRSLWNNTHT